MINFTVGPVQSSDAVRALGAEQVPYFRTAEFSEIMLENEKLMLQFTNAPAGSRAVFLTGSGTASMEAAVMNTLTKDDRVIVVNGGSFGHRFVELLQLHNIPYSEIKLEYGKALTEQDLQPYSQQGYTAFVINIHETSTGVLYNIDLVSRFCKENGLFLLVDSISSFLCDPFDMSANGAGLMLTGSQKALACPPGISIIVLSPEALERVKRGRSACMYLDLKEALKNQERGQTPFTPAVGTLLQIHARLKEIEAAGGVNSEIQRMHGLACYFREKITQMPFEVISESLSNAVTPLHPLTSSAYEIFLKLKDEYGIWVCPNGGELRDTVFRVGHLGNLNLEDYDKLLSALHDMQKRGLI